MSNFMHYKQENFFFQKTIIMWSESDGKTYALSFLNEKDREELWTRIEEV